YLQHDRVIKINLSNDKSQFYGSSRWLGLLKHMRSGLAISFVVLYLVALCKPAWPLIDYYANRDFFAEVLCINKDKPALHCNGRCVLMQKLKAAAREETPAGPLPKI